MLQDSVDEFRALCWALYALYANFPLNGVSNLTMTHRRPLEIRAQQYIDAFIHNFSRVLNLFSISHKYHFESLETWAKEVLYYHCWCINTDGKNASSVGLLDAT